MKGNVFGLLLLLSVSLALPTKPTSRIEIVAPDGSGQLTINHQNAVAGFTATTSSLQFQCLAAGLLEVTLTTTNEGTAQVAIGPGGAGCGTTVLDTPVTDAATLSLETTVAQPCGRMEPAAADGKQTFTWEVKVNEQVYPGGSEKTEPYNTVVTVSCIKELTGDQVDQLDTAGNTATESSQLQSKIEFKLTKLPSTGAIWKFNFAPENSALLVGGKFIVDSCVARPEIFDAQIDLIENSCLADTKTTAVRQGDGFEITVGSFRFRSAPDESVRIECKAKLCTTTECSDKPELTLCTAPPPRILGPEAGGSRKTRSVEQSLGSASIVVPQ